MASHLGLHYVLRPVCPNTYGKYSRFMQTVSPYVHDCIAPDEALFIKIKVLIFSYFSKKICCGYSLEAP